ncbi:hypothetical protein HQ447_15565 [bacterium]|nr:hypothetical protein [bacterium]
MKTRTATLLGLAITAICLPVNAASVEIRVDGDKPTVPLSAHLDGLFFEDINFGADGGLDAELVQNRSFESYKVTGRPGGDLRVVPSACRTSNAAKNTGNLCV